MEMPSITYRLGYNLIPLPLGNKMLSVDIATVFKSTFAKFRKLIWIN